MNDDAAKKFKIKIKNIRLTFIRRKRTAPMRWGVKGHDDADNRFNSNHRRLSMAIKVAHMWASRFIKTPFYRLNIRVRRRVKDS